MSTALFGLVEWTILLHGDEQDVVFEENQQEDSDKSKQIDQTA